MRLIDADALIDDIKNHLWDWETVNGITAQTVLKQTITDVENQPTASPWHRVEVEEPTKAGRYLVMDVDGDFNVDEWHNTFGWQFVTPSDADRITHWMPIEPPKEDA